MRGRFFLKAGEGRALFLCADSCQRKSGKARGFAGAFVFPNRPPIKFWSSFYKSLRFPMAEPLGASVTDFFPLEDDFRPLCGRFFGSFFAPPAAKKRTKRRFFVLLHGRARGVGAAPRKGPGAVPRKGQCLSFAMKNMGAYRKAVFHQYQKGRDFLAPFSHNLACKV